MTWTSREIDQRNQLNGIMRYQIKCSLPWFFDARNWCWDNLGPGIEHEHFVNFSSLKRLADDTDRADIKTSMGIPRWCWHAAKWQGASIDHGKIYIATEQDMVLFSERWNR